MAEPTRCALTVNEVLTRFLLKCGIADALPG
jgi:hypothetical protein